MKGKVAFVTGSAVGIGRTFASALAKRGAAVVVADIDLDAAERTAAEIAQTGARAFGVRCDVADESEIDLAVRRTVEEFGGIDILINNAALHLAYWSRPVTELPRELWRKLLDVNVLGIVNCAAACREPMRARGGGVILNMSSITGFMPGKGPGLTSSYAVTKLAVKGLTVALAVELAPDNIRVIGIAPGAVQSEAAVAEQGQGHFDAMVELQLVKRAAQMDDLVGPMLFLCSDQARMVTGETMLVSGGYPLRV